MRTIEVNPANWVSKENVKVKVTNDGRFEVYGYKFRMETKPCIDPDTKEDLGTFATVFIQERTGERKAFSGFQMKAGGEWCFHSLGVEREDSDPFVAATQIICNTF
jgi:hypothetical protein